ncbi:shikimate dehydrogenase [Sinobacterium caligoides]|uniref:Shikimate dehydrogenase (NADP(+)) n=1 Tax=Sinobacterium caligoides TaxID=933926 RepID=A0A3N2DGQ4_9GAMM|nr:shikimate dehydrogenase [Sinobacterium caligoides]ROR98986.1 shikimate dehydrogenase [Sinobacterium caligoides]
MRVDQYAVFGNPIEHSRSPDIHHAFARETDQSLAYGKQCVPVDDFTQAAVQFFADGGRGLNITVPFKLEAYQFADTLTKRARQAGAVNTLAVQADGSILGDNTDGIGMVSDIVDHLGWSLAGRRVLVLGAGGAVRGVLGPILAQQPSQLVIANRTSAKAEALAKAFTADIAVVGCGFERLDGHQFDVVINGTSASLAGDLPPLPATLLATEGKCYDMMYGAEPTVFMRWAQQHGAASVSDGLGMLVGQAAEAFALWRDVRPSVAPVIEVIRAELTA